VRPHNDEVILVVKQGSNDDSLRQKLLSRAKQVNLERTQAVLLGHHTFKYKPFTSRFRRLTEDDGRGEIVKLRMATVDRYNLLTTIGERTRKKWVQRCKLDSPPYEGPTTDVNFQLPLILMDYVGVTRDTEKLFRNIMAKATLIGCAIKFDFDFGWYLCEN